MTVYELFKKADFNVIAKSIADKDDCINMDKTKTEEEKDEMRKKEVKILLKALSDMLKTPVKENPDEIIACVKVVDLERKESFMDVFMIYRNDLLTKDIYVYDADDPDFFAPDLNSFSERFIESYAFDFESWEDILGYTVSEVCISEYGAEAVAEAVFHEMTFFGLDYETATEKRDEVKQDLIDSAKEAEAGAGSYITMDELYDKYGFERPSEEEKKEQERIWKEEAKINQDEKVRVLEQVVAEFKGEKNGR